MKHKKKKKVISTTEEAVSDALEVNSPQEESECVSENIGVEMSSDPDTPKLTDEDMADSDKSADSTEESVTVSEDSSPSDKASEEQDNDVSEENEQSDAEAKKKREKAPRKKGDVSPVKLILTLSVICVAIAMLLGGINMVTRVRISKAAEKEKTDAILSVFSEGDSSKLYKTTDKGDEVHLVYKGKSIIGYCVFTTASGFGGDIKMIVGIDTDYTTCGVRIISMSETPGVGTKTNTLGFLDRFIGGSHSSPIEGVEAISGATISSEAIKSAVASAHKIDFDLNAAAADVGAELITVPEKDESENSESQSPSTPDGESSSESENSPESTPSGSVSDSIDPTESVDTSEPTEETSDIPFVENGGGRVNGVYVIGVGTSYDHYVIEVTKVTDESGEIIFDPVEVSTEAPTAPPTEAPTAPPVTEPITSATTTIQSIPIITTAPESTSSPMGSVSLPPSEDTSSEPVPTETTPSEPTPTTPTAPETPVSPDTSDPNGDEEPIVQPGVSIDIPIVGKKQ